jgi:hypothetical protein
VRKATTRPGKKEEKGRQAAAQGRRKLIGPDHASRLIAIVGGAGLERGDFALEITATVIASGCSAAACLPLGTAPGAGAARVQPSHWDVSPPHG